MWNAIVHTRDNAKLYDMESMVNKASVKFVYLIVWYTIWNSINKITHWLFREKYAQESFSTERGNVAVHWRKLHRGELCIFLTLPATVSYLESFKLNLRHGSFRLEAKSPRLFSVRASTRCRRIRNIFDAVKDYDKMNVSGREAHMANRRKAYKDLFEILGRRNKVLDRNDCGMLTWILKNQNLGYGLGCTAVPYISSG